MDADALRKAMAALPQPPSGSGPPHWDYWRCDLWGKVQTEDPRTFMAWPSIYHTMLVNHWSMAAEFEFLQGDFERWGPATLPHVGQPIDYFMGTPYSANMINQAYHLALWESKTGRRIEGLKSIVEFGGGYGAMALLCRRLGFRGDYVIHDLPEFSLLQQWFLAEEGVEGVHWNETPERIDLLIALYSLSEMPIRDRNKFLESVEPESYLFLYSPVWESYDNLSYFQQFRGQVRREWFSQVTPRKVDWYLIGW